MPEKSNEKKLDVEDLLKTPHQGDSIKTPDQGDEVITPDQGDRMRDDATAIEYGVVREPLPPPEQPPKK